MPLGYVTVIWYSVQCRPRALKLKKLIRIKKNNVHFELIFLSIEMMHK